MNPTSPSYNQTSQEENISSQDQSSGQNSWFTQPQSHQSQWSSGPGQQPDWPLASQQNIFSGSSSHSQTDSGGAIGWAPITPSQHLAVSHSGRNPNNYHEADYSYFHPQAWATAPSPSISYPATAGMIDLDHHDSHDRENPGSTDLISNTQPMIPEDQRLQQSSPHDMASTPTTPDESGGFGPTISEAASAVGSLTKKNWELPPRAKPGRKPDLKACDTKRKEQNREAQRAFRERRAAKVEELRDELARRHEEWKKEMDLLKREHEVERNSLFQTLGQLKAEAFHQHQRAEREAKRRKELEEELMKRQRFDEHRYLRTARWSSNSTNSSANMPSSISSISSSAQISPTNTGPFPLLPEPIASPNTDRKLPSSACRRCGREGGCHCVESTLARLPDPEQNLDAHEPAPQKQQQQQQETMEIDFTRSTQNPNSDLSIEPESCGFCTSPDNCLCNISAQDPAADQSSVSRLQQQPSSSTKPEPMEPRSGPKGPGSCDQCIADPSRRRFCQALAEESKHACGSSGIEDTVTCSVAYDMLSSSPNIQVDGKNHRMMQALRTMAPDARRRTTALDVDTASVLAALKHHKKDTDGGKVDDETNLGVDEE